MESQNIDKMDELILASLQELAGPPGNANYGEDTNGPTVKRPYQRHLADASKKGICQVLGCDQPLGTAYAKCSRFHPVAEFDGFRRTCRIRLAQHNTRRRLIRAMQRADREASPHHSSGEDIHARRHYHNTVSHQVPRYQSHASHVPPPHHHHQHVPSRSAGNADMHAALLGVALASLNGESVSNGMDMRPSSMHMPQAYVPPLQSHPAPIMYRPPSIISQPAPPALLPAPAPPLITNTSSAENLINNLDPQQLVQMLQLIMSLQQMGCSLDQLEHPEVLPLMMTLLQNA